MDLQPDDVCLCLLAYARHLKNNSKYAKAKQDYRVLDPLLLILLWSLVTPCLSSHTNPLSVCLHFFVGG